MSSRYDGLSWCYKIKQYGHLDFTSCKTITNPPQQFLRRGQYIQDGVTQRQSYEPFEVGSIVHQYLDDGIHDTTWIENAQRLFREFLGNVIIGAIFSLSFGGKRNDFDVHVYDTQRKASQRFWHLLVLIPGRHAMYFTSKSMDSKALPSSCFLSLRMLHINSLKHTRMIDTTLKNNNLICTVRILHSHQSRSRYISVTIGTTTVADSLTTAADAADKRRALNLGHKRLVSGRLSASTRARRLRSI